MEKGIEKRLVDFLKLCNLNRIALKKGMILGMVSSSIGRMDL